MADAIPLFVCIPVADVQKPGMCGFFATPESNKGIPFPVGRIEGYDGLDMVDLKMVRRDLAPFGDVQPIVMPLLDRPGYVGALIALAVFAPNYDIAKEIPGFVPIWNYVKHIWQPPRPDNVATDGISRHRFIGEVLPPYQDGVHMESMIPRGELATMIFFEDDPLNYYSVHGVATTKRSDEIVDIVRQWRIDNP